MEGEQFSLCWNNFHNNLSSGFHSLLQDEDLVDVTLAAEGRYIKAHKTVLSVCSPYFKELFRVNPCKHPIVILQDVNYSALSNLMQFMYQGEVSVSQDEIPMFMRVAETLKVKGLTENASTTDTNGLESTSNRNSPQFFDNTSVTRSNLQTMRRPRQVKKIIKPIQHLKPIELSVKSPSPQSKSPQPLAKRQCLMENQSENAPEFGELPAQPKQEPVEQISDEYREGSYDGHLDVSSMLDTTISEPSPSNVTPPHQSLQNWKNEIKGPVDALSPGTLQCILGKRGNPRLIVDGHVFYKKSSYKGKSFWYCKHGRTSFRCTAACWTLNGNIVKWPTYHTHHVIPDTFNPDEDTEVPIKHLQEVLMQSN